MLHNQSGNYGDSGKKEAREAAAGAQVEQVEGVGGQGNQQGRQRPVPPQAGVVPEDGVGDEQVADNDAQEAAAEGFGRAGRQPAVPEGAEVAAKAADAAVSHQVIRETQRAEPQRDEEVGGGNGGVEVVAAQPLVGVKELAGQDERKAIDRRDVFASEVRAEPLVAAGEPGRAAEAEGEGEDQDGEFQRRHGRSPLSWTSPAGRTCGRRC